MIGLMIVLAFGASHYAATFLAVRRLHGEVTVRRMMQHVHPNPWQFARELVTTRGRVLRHADQVLLLIAYSIVAGFLAFGIVAIVKTRFVK